MVKALQEEGASFSNLGNLQKEVQGMLQHLAEYKVQHVLGMGNEAAHRLACNAWKVENIEMWRDDVLMFVSQAVRLDKT